MVWLAQRGTAAYMAPELISFTHAPSFAVDVYSFGVVLHHIITGMEPSHGQDPRPLRHAIGTTILGLLQSYTTFILLNRKTNACRTF
jgi:serine/threonine protein kinase